MRVLAIDLGSRRIGVAVSDPTGTLASPVTVIGRGRDRAGDHGRIADLAAEYEAERVLVGLPRSLDGSLGPSALAALDEIEELKALLTVPVEAVDERFTTVTASRRLRTSGKTGRQQAALIDAAAAAVLLQSWLDGPGRTAVPVEEQ
ncbi:MAG: Holliday junction resolvase RuvX [Acidimicrobiales bacterium]